MRNNSQSDVLGAESSCSIQKLIPHKVLDGLNSNSQEKCMTIRRTFLYILVAKNLGLKNL